MNKGKYFRLIIFISMSWTVFSQVNFEILTPLPLSERLTLLKRKLLLVNLLDDTRKYYKADETITINSGKISKPNGEVLLKAGETVRIKGEFKVEKGAYLKVITGNQIAPIHHIKLSDKADGKVKADGLEVEYISFDVYSWEKEQVAPGVPVYVDKTIPYEEIKSRVKIYDILPSGKTINIELPQLYYRTVYPGTHKLYVMIDGVKSNEITIEATALNGLNSLVVKDKTYPTIEIEWNKLNEADEYKITIENNGKIIKQTTNKGVTGYGFYMSEIRDNKEYKVKVQAYNKNKELLKEKEVTFNLELEKPINFKDDGVDGNSIYLSWKKSIYPEGTKYEIEWRESNSTEYKNKKTVKKENILIDNLKLNTNYNVRIRAVYGNISSEYIEKSVKTLSKKLNFRISQMDNVNFEKSNIKLEWENIDESTGYYIYMSTNGIDYKILGSTTDNYYIDNDVSENRWYKIIVRK
ncbi:fibronectin type III domain-containing protein [Haliovirga abyssi]|uniref:Fibronectin type-III domain-containing protein n=1 Tax=Haliovirga abyssi TaxID=2996794 RepID=A0AAU9D6N9_9FUSO|nr:fibronectin type III domain-containing protein [Haliovirga abyssi]BDU51686.1 hypothetical protein HLVA_22550 [Haliovirga abyssi]